MGHVLPFSSSLAAEMTYAQSAERGEVLATVRYAVLNGSLWAIGSAWSTAIRAIVIAVIPTSTREVVAGEMLAAGITTGMGVLVALLVTRQCGSTCA